MAARLYMILSVLIFALLLAVDVALGLLDLPPIPIREHSVALGLAIVAAAGGLYRHGFRRGLELGQRLARVDQYDDEVVVPIRRSG